MDNLSSTLDPPSYSPLRATLMAFVDLIETRVETVSADM